MPRVYCVSCLVLCCVVLSLTTNRVKLFNITIRFTSLHLVLLFIHIESDQMFAQDLVSGGVVDVGVLIVVIVVALTVVVRVESMG